MPAARSPAQEKRAAREGDPFVQPGPKAVSMSLLVSGFFFSSRGSRGHGGVGGRSSSGGSGVGGGSVGGRSSVRGGVGGGSGVGRSVSGLVFGGGLASSQGQSGGRSGDQSGDAHGFLPSEGSHEVMNPRNAGDNGFVSMSASEILTHS